MGSGDLVGSLLMLGSTLCVLAATYLACYTFFAATWEGWESWYARTGLDAERADEDRRKKLR